MQPRHRRAHPCGPHRSRPDPRHAAAPLLGLAVVVLVLAWWRAPGEVPVPPAPAPSPGAAQEAPRSGTGSTGLAAAVAREPAATDALRDPRADPASVLAAWDSARARAYARASADDLTGLYLPGAVAGRRDARLLAAYAARGLRVRGMRMDVSRVEVLRARARTRVLRVTDRLVGARAVRADGTSYPLPRDRPSTRTVRLVHEDGRWRVAAVGPAG